MRTTATGQLYQSQTSEFRIFSDEGFDYTLRNWQDLKVEYGSEKKTHNATDGSLSGWTADPVKTSGGVKIRLDEVYSLEEAWLAFDPTTPLLQAEFNFTITHGNVVSKLKKDSGKLMFQKQARDLPSGSDPLMVDMPLLILDFKSNGAAPLFFPV